MVIYPYPAAGDIGKVVTPTRGSFICNRESGSFWLFLAGDNHLIPIKQVGVELIPHEVTKITGSRPADDGIDGHPVGFRDEDALSNLGSPGPRRHVVDLKQLAEESAHGQSPSAREVWKHATKPAGGPASEADSEALRPADLRVLYVYVDRDNTETRYKDWRKVVLESKTVTYADVPLQGPLSALNWCRHTHRFGGNPRLWFTEFARAKSIQSTDRVYHEVSTLVDAIYHAGTYDQYNLGCSICVEVLARRIQSIVDAYSNPGRIDFTQARHFIGSGSLEDAIDPALRDFVARKSKDEAEIQNARDKARQLSGPVAAATYQAQPTPLPGAPGPGKPKRKARKSTGEGASKE